MSWDVSGSGLGMFSDGFEIVLNKTIGRGRKMLDGIDTYQISKMVRIIFLGQAASE